VLGVKWRELNFQHDVATNFDIVTKPLIALAGITIDEFAITSGIVLPGRAVSDEIADAYRKHLFGDTTLQDLPSDQQGPRFIINATNAQTKVLWRFSRAYMGDYRVGLTPNPRHSLALAVAASSAFPPFLSPVVMKFPAGAFAQGSDPAVEAPPYTTKVGLTDGGVYDNLGLETAYKVYDTVLVCDGGGGCPDEPAPHRDWARHAKRAVDIINNQVGSLRKRQLIGAFQLGLRKGTYWGIRSDIADYNLPSAISWPHNQTLALADTPTRLAEMNTGLRQTLVNWGYAIGDAAMRKHVCGEAAAPTPQLPFPSAP
jgi:NTE family protein